MGAAQNNVARIISCFVILLLAIVTGGCCASNGTTLLGVKWADFRPFRANLVSSEQGTLDSMKDASVYQLDIEIAADLQTVSGQEEVRYTNRESVDLPYIYFRLFPNESGGKTTVSAVTVDSKKAGFEISSDATALKVMLAQPLKPGEPVILKLDFTVKMPADKDENFGLLGYFNNVLALDSFFPIIPVYDDNGWHIEVSSPQGDKTYNDAAFFLVRIKTPASLVLVTSGVEVSREEQNGNQIVTVADGPARDFYITASDQFAKMSATLGETTINSYYLPGEETGAQEVLSVAQDAIKVYGNRLGEYPYTEFDAVPLELSGGGIGMEYPGVVGIAMSIYDNSQVLETTVAHEIGHQWFYNAVGNDQVNQPWLDESVTQYITGLYYLDTGGQAGWDNSNAYWNSFWGITGKANIPIGLPVSSYTGNTYGSIVYGRGPLFVAALADFIGDDAFQGCLRGYYQNFKWQTVSTASFENWFQSCSGKNIDPLFREWVLP